jgi:two-component system NtrC family sensor kinase
VRDNRIDIPPKKKDRLKPTGEGTRLGLSMLGLSISYEIVTQQHGGTITVDSELGDCAEFTVRLLRRDDREIGFRTLACGSTLPNKKPT